MSCMLQPCSVVTSAVKHHPVIQDASLVVKGILGLMVRGEDGGGPVHGIHLASYWCAGK